MWAVVVKVNHNRQVKKFTERAEAEGYLAKAQELLRKVPSVKIGLVSTSTPTPPPVFLPQRGRLWCPYCATQRVFAADESGYVRCDLCGISENEYYVKLYNKTFN